MFLILTSFFELNFDKADHIKNIKKLIKLLIIQTTLS